MPQKRKTEIAVITEKMAHVGVKTSVCVDAISTDLKKVKLEPIKPFVLMSYDELMFKGKSIMVSYELDRVVNELEYDVNYCVPIVQRLNLQDEPQWIQRGMQMAMERRVIHCRLVGEIILELQALLNDFE